MNWNENTDVPEQYIDIEKGNVNTFIDGMIFRNVTDYNGEKVLKDQMSNLKRSDTGNNIKMFSIKNDSQTFNSLVNVLTWLFKAIQ